MKAKHALLSASSAYRWMACPPSAKLASSYKDEGSTYAAEGTDAHSLCEYKLKTALGREADDPTKNLTYFNEEMDAAAEAYAGYVLEQLQKVKDTTADPVVLIEQQVDFSRWVPQGFGTADCVIVADKVLNVIDFKYGQGVLVEAGNNPQMMCYALGALSMMDALYNIDEVIMTIFQPRRDNISSFLLSVRELYDWADKELKPKAQLAFTGKGEYAAGDWCRFCKAKVDCRARAEANLELAKLDFAMPPILSDADIEAILPTLDELTSWAADLKDYALSRALSGKVWHGFKLVEGRSNRRYISEDAVAQTVMEAGFDPYEKKLLGITAMQKLLGKKHFEELLGALIEKPQGKPALVSESDKRPAMQTASQDFMEDNDND